MPANLGADYPHNGTLTYDVLLTNGEATLSEPITIQGCSLAAGKISGDIHLTLNETFNWASGALAGNGLSTIDALSGINLTTSDAKWFSGVTLNLYGDSDCSGTGPIQSDTGAINNFGRFEVQHDLEFNGNWPYPLFNNSGLFRIRGGANLVQFGNWIFNNSGLIDLQAGTLNFAGFGTSSGAFNTATGAVLRFSGGAQVLVEGARFTGGGVCSVDYADYAPYTPAIVRINGNVTNFGDFELHGGIIDGPAEFHVADGAVLVWDYAGEMDGEGATVIDPGGRLVLESGSINTRKLRNTGTMSWTGPGGLQLNGGIIENSGTLEITNQMSCSRDAFSSANATQSLMNSGLIRFAPGLSNALTLVGVAFTNSGEVVIGSGNFTTRTASFQGAPYWQISGTTRLAGGNINASLPSQVVLQGGCLVGSGSLGDVTNNASIDLGDSAGILNTGALTLSSNSHLKIKIGGLAPGTGYNQINVGGDGATLAGTLTIELSGFRPALGDSFQILNYHWRTGYFSKIEGLYIGDGLRLAPYYSPTALILMVNNAPRVDQRPLIFSVVSRGPLPEAILSWPPEFAGFWLQWTTNLTKPNWSPGVPIWTNSFNFLLSGPPAFFRLVEP